MNAGEGGGKPAGKVSVPSVRVGFWGLSLLGKHWVAVLSLLGEDGLLMLLLVGERWVSGLSCLGGYWVWGAVTPRSHLSCLFVCHS